MSECSVDGCDRPRYARQEVCEPHYRRLRRTGSLSPDLPIGGKRPERTCLAHDCERPSTERGLCHGHYLRLLRTGSIGSEPLGRRKNDLCIASDCDNVATARGLCSTHRARQRHHGDLLAERPVKKPGGGTVSHGYRTVAVPAHLRHLTNGDRRAAEHRLVMAMMLGRPLLPTESVHHRDGDRLNNDPNNLELWSRWQPSGQRLSDKLEAAMALLETYLPGALNPAPPLPLPVEVDNRE